LVAGGASKSVTESSLIQNGLVFPDVLVSLNTVPTAAAKESRVRRATPPYRCSGVTACFAVMSGTSLVELLFLVGSPLSVGKGLPPPARAAKGAEAHAIIVATLPPKNIRRETAITSFSLANHFVWPEEPGKLENWAKLGEFDNILRIPFWEWEFSNFSNRR
jgi:hypothetical protein